MSLLCFASARGAPGVTLTALAVAAAMPVHGNGRKLLIEADPAGGVVATRYQLGRQPGLVSLAAAQRHGLSVNDVWHHAQELPGDLPVIVAPERGDRVSSILRSAGSQLGSWLASLPDVAVIADCGRLDPANVASGLIPGADGILLVANPTTEQIHAGAALLEQLREAGHNGAWLLIGDRPHTAAEVERVSGVEVARMLPHEPRSAMALVEGSGIGRLRRRPLIREISSFANDLAGLLEDWTESSDDPAEKPVAIPVEEVAP